MPLAVEGSEGGRAVPPAPKRADEPAVTTLPRKEPRLPSGVRSPHPGHRRDALPGQPMAGGAMGVGRGSRATTLPEARYDWLWPRPSGDCDKGGQAGKGADIGGQDDP